MNALIEVFRMDEIDSKTRAKVIIKLGAVINHQYASNVTEPLVYELVKILDPKSKIFKDENFIKKATK